MNYLKYLEVVAINQRILVLLFQISNDTTIDAGNIINSLDDEAYKINHIFVTHVSFRSCK